VDTCDPPSPRKLRNSATDPRRIGMADRAENSPDCLLNHTYEGIYERVSDPVPCNDMRPADVC